MIYETDDWRSFSVTQKHLRRFGAGGRAGCQNQEAPHERILAQI
jgi:hypothetical protein